ncbi:HipA domain-containing protein [uncultured Aeromicrobium sp.]|uniref:HipA domain-containing protein n=1 Tax=uncultured Aeromicrobium sp. TaxID=337820 RepID=UPI0025FC07DE|nr:HipA domain-containing protein [uncultured Aeromicrobium sp.]
MTSGGHYEPVDEQYIGKRLREVGADGASWTRPDEAWSLAGAQAKFALAYIDGRWFEAHGAAPTTHIFKPGISRLKHQASVEHLTARVFDRLGVRAAPTRIEAFDGVPALVVTRYDRRRVPLTASAASRRPTPPPTGRPAGWHNRIARVHQVDLCQALKYSPLNKYEAERGPGIRQVVDLLRRVGDNGGVEAFAKAAIANVVTGSPDAHAKNYSLLWLEGRWLLAPVYDVATALPYDSSVGEIDTVAMAVGGERRLDRIGRHHWAKFATAVGFPQDTVHSWLFEMLDEVEAAFNAELDMLDVELGQKELRDRLLPTLSHHIARLRRLYAPR